MAINDAEVVRAKLARFGYPEKIPRRIAQRLIMDSAWWYDHPSGPVRAPKHKENVEQGPYGWQLAFGANAFLVESAVRDCLGLVSSAIDQYKSTGKKEEAEKLKEQMRLAIRGS